MTADRLSPSLDLLSQEYVLVQAWKKTASYIRSHNWYADTLDLDETAVNLPRFLAELSDRFKNPDQWKNDLLRMVPAPKRQEWQLKAKVWGPVPLKKVPENKGRSPVELRPLAHVSIRDQVACSAIMLCLADRVETLQGDPRGDFSDKAVRKGVVSYGNRLYCDEDHDQLKHRWGSAKLYRVYAQDYRAFIDRPEIVAESLNGRRAVVVHSDLRQFYDRVHLELLTGKLRSLQRPDDDPAFFDLACRILQWEWHRSDRIAVKSYEAQAGIEDFSRVSLPQGLVASGFFSNVVLLDFDQGLKSAFSQEIAPGLVLHDACRYVDDLRFVITDEKSRQLLDIEELVSVWMKELLDRCAPGLEASRKKTLAVDFEGDERPLVRQSRKMNRIQSEVSGGFDAIGGEDILEAVQGLLRTQQRYSGNRTEDQGWAFAPVADVRDDTVARFAAARYRSTYRSLRPLLSTTDEPVEKLDEEEDDSYAQHRRIRSRSELDNDARAFALGLIEQWVYDPSNVRLLRIGLDIWPAEDVLSNILNLLKSVAAKGGQRKGPRRVAWYCLAEILRAGATETGFVEDNESLPTACNISAYRTRLKAEAMHLASPSSTGLPWYLKQQALLFLAANAPKEAPVSRTGRSAETSHYRALIRYLRGDRFSLTGADNATLAILARRAFLSKDEAVLLAIQGITTSRIDQISQRDPAFAAEIVQQLPTNAPQVSPRVRDDLGLNVNSQSDGRITLARAIAEVGPRNCLRNELSLLRFACRFLDALKSHQSGSEIVITPSDILLEVQECPDGGGDIRNLAFATSRVAPSGSIYMPPSWCSPDSRWRFQLGFVLRFILSAQPDFATPVKPPHWKECEAVYRRPESHWYQKIYGLFSGHSAFGDDWLPISNWTESLLFALLAWPGCRSTECPFVQEGLVATHEAIVNRIRELDDLQGPTKSVFLLRWMLPRPDKSNAMRSLRGCVVQLAVPSGPEEPGKDSPYAIKESDPTCSEPEIRRHHRNHLSAALAAVEKMLDLRETHQARGGRLDWLILPELSVHPEDVRTHLIPFARAHKAIVLAGMTYQQLLRDQPLVNSALWVVPVWSPAHGLQVQLRRQGKQHLAPVEMGLNSRSEVVRGFRPCQWLVGYDWSANAKDLPLWLSAAICYDATDLRLATDLRGKSDVFAIPALNKDVTTFDQMSLALHYHMYQMVIVANNGQFGGSSAYWPKKDSWIKQVFHMHGQPQASISLFEIDDINHFIIRNSDRTESSLPDRSPTPSWKPQPAGWRVAKCGGVRP